MNRAKQPQGLFYPNVIYLPVPMGKNTLSHDLVISSFKLHKNGLTPIGKPTFTDWQTCGAFIQEAEQSVQFWIGDWLKPRDILRRFS
jgi:hypothetical protein